MVDHYLDTPLQAQDGLSSGATMLMLAAKHGDTARCKELIASRASVHKVDSDGHSALHHACINDQADAVDILLKHKADCDAPNNNGDSPLCIAAASNSTGSVTRLLAAGADAQARNKAGLRAPDVAQTFAVQDMLHAEIARQLHVPLVAAVSSGDNVEARRLLQSRADVNKKAEDGRTALHHAAMRGEQDLVRELAKARADVNALTSKEPDTQCTPLMLCAANGHVHALETLIRCKADVTMKDLEGQDALSLSQAKAFTMHFNAMNEVVGLDETKVYETDDVDHGNPDQPTSPGGTVAPELLDALAKQDPTLALNLCAKDGLSDCFLDLIHQGAKVNYADVNGQTPLHSYVSVPGAIPAGVDILARAGTDIDRQDEQGCTPLMCAVGARNHTIVKALVDLSANRAIKNKKKQTAFDLANELALRGEVVLPEELDLLRPPAK